MMWYQKNNTKRAMSNFVYRWPFFFWLSILLVFAAFLAVKSSMVSPSQGEELHSLIESSPRQIRKEHKKETRELTQQTRIGVTKQIYVADGPLRRLVDITASRSKLRVVSKRPHMRVLETFYEVKGVVQHELFYTKPDGTELVYNADGKLAYRNKKLLEPEFDQTQLIPKQHFRYFTAKEAMFDFHTNQLLAYDVKFWTYTAAGHQILKAPFTMPAAAIGQASVMTFYVSGSRNQNQFSAEFLKVQFTPEGGI